MHECVRPSNLTREIHGETRLSLEEHVYFIRAENRGLKRKISCQCICMEQNSLNPYHLNIYLKKIEFFKLDTVM